MASSAAILLDTHVWLWAALGDMTHFRRKTIETIDEAAQEDRLYLAAISLWEVAMLESKGRIRLTLPCADWLKQAVRGTGVTVAPLEIDIAAASCTLTGFHGDPADRLIVATAVHRNATLLTEDKNILDSAKKNGFRATRLK